MTAARGPYRIGALSLLLSERDLLILEDLERFRLLDTRLIQRLRFPAGEAGGHATESSATRTALRVLTRLEGHALIARIGRRVGGAGHGSSQTVWQLAASGERFLRVRKGQTGRRRYVDPGNAFLEHTLAVARYAADLLEGARRDGFEVLVLQTEPESWRPFQTGHGGAVTLKPDLYVVTADADSETHSFVEIDRDTEHLPAVLRKCRTYQQYRQSGAEQAGLDGLFPAVVWAAPDTRRANRIRAAIDRDGTLDSRLFASGTAASTLAAVAPYSSPNTKGGHL